MEELIRSLIWGVMHITLIIIDSLWQIAKMICGLDFAGQDWIWDWFLVLEVFFVLFLIFRIVKVFFKALTDDEYMQKLNVQNFIIKAFISILIFTMTPWAIKQINVMVSDLVSNVEVFSPGGNGKAGSDKLSTLIINTTNSDVTNIKGKVKTYEELLKEQKSDMFKSQVASESIWKLSVENWKRDNPNGNVKESRWKETYDEYVKSVKDTVDKKYKHVYWLSHDMNDININAGEDDSDILNEVAHIITFGLIGIKKVYYLYPSWMLLFFGLILSIATLLVFVPIVIQMATRVVSLVVKVFLGPYAISTMADPENNTFQTWIKYMGADFFLNFFQLYSLRLMFAFLGSDTMKKMLYTTINGKSEMTGLTMVAQAFFLIGGLLAIYQAPTGITAIIGGSDMAGSTALQQIQSIMSLGRIGGASVVTAGAGTLALGMKAGAMGGKGAMKLGRYGIGKLGFGGSHNGGSSGGGSSSDGFGNMDNSGGSSGFDSSEGSSSSDGGYSNSSSGGFDGSPNGGFGATAKRYTQAGMKKAASGVNVMYMACNDRINRSSVIAGNNHGYKVNRKTGERSVKPLINTDRFS